MNWIELLKYLVLGIVQGLTEPLPISSSGHLVLFQYLLSMDLPGLDFEIIVNAASLFAIVAYFWKDVWALTVGVVRFVFLRKKEHAKQFRYFLFLIVASIPAGIIGFVLKTAVEANKSLLMAGMGLFLTAFTLLVVAKKRDVVETESITIQKSIWIGLAQALAILPGVSRSGMTVSMSLRNKLSMDEALKFSFLLFIPISLASLVLSGVQVWTNPSPSFSIPGLILAFLASLITTGFALRLFVKVLKKQKLQYFSLYCVIVGFLAVLFHYIG